MTSLRHVGVACAYHAEYEIVTVVNFAAVIKDKKTAMRLPQPGTFIARTHDTQDFDSGYPNKRLQSQTASPSYFKASGSKHQQTRDQDYDGNDDDLEEDEDWPEDAVSMKEDKTEDIKAGKKIVKIRRRFKMADGSVVTKEFQTVERIR